MHRIAKWLAPLIIVAAGWLPPAAAQPVSVPRTGHTNEPEKEERVPAFQYTVAILFTMVILVIVCKPSRKGVKE
jgi:hypothetical protein